MGIDISSFVYGSGRRKTTLQKHYEKLTDYLKKLKKYAYHIKVCSDERNSYHKTISDISTYICNNFKDDINLKNISEQFFISPSYFSRTFKKVTGLTFVEYLNSIRIKESQKLIATTTLTIAEISEIVGYKSNTHFGRIFKNIVGTTPNASRQSLKFSVKN